MSETCCTAPLAKLRFMPLRRDVHCPLHGRNSDAGGAWRVAQHRLFHGSAKTKPDQPDQPDLVVEVDDKCLNLMALSTLQPQAKSS